MFASAHKAFWIIQGTSRIDFKPTLRYVFMAGEGRKAIFRYDSHGHLTEILHDALLTSVLRDPHSGELVSVSTADCTLRFHRNGPLVERHTVASSTDGGMLAVFDYTSDSNLRLSSIEVKMSFRLSKRNAFILASQIWSRSAQSIARSIYVQISFQIHSTHF